MLVVEVERCFVVEIDGERVYGLCAVGTDGGNHALVNGPREHEAPIVIGVLSDEIDAARRGIEALGGLTEMFVESVGNHLGCERCRLFCHNLLGI